MKTNKSAVSKDTVPPLEMSSDNIKKENASKEDDVTVKEEQIFIKDEEELHFQTSSAQQGCGSQDITAQHEKQDGLQCQAPLNAIKEEQMAEPFGSIHAGISAEEQNFSSDHREDFERHMNPSLVCGSWRDHSDEDDSCSSSSNWSRDVLEDFLSVSSGSNSSTYAGSEEEDSESEMDNSELHVDRSWAPIVASQRSFRFTGQEELLKKPTPSGENNTVLPLDLYVLFVTDEVIDYIVNGTNRNATKILQSKAMKRKARLAKWKPTYAEEMRKFLGIVMCMGLVRVPKIEHYWSKSEIYNYSFIRNHMSRDRFMLLLNMLHCNDSKVIDRQNKLRKIQPLVDTVAEACRSVYTPGSNVVIDESFIPFRGRGIRGEYNPAKAHKYGLKIYKLCSPNLYTLNFLVCSGNLSKEPTVQRSESVVLQLSRPLVQQGSTIYAGSSYSSVPLAEKLLQAKIYYCGTVRKNQEALPQAITKAKLKKGEIVGLMNDKGVKVCSWKNKCNILTLSTVPEHSDNLQPSKKKNRSGVEILKPQSILDYSAAALAIRKPDELTSCNSAIRSSTKWYRKLAIEVLTGIAVINAWALYNQFYSHQKTMELIEFKECLVMSLITGKNNEKIRPGPRPSNIGGQRSSHALVEPTGTVRKTRKRCRSCYEITAKCEGSAAARRKARKVATFCDTCEGNPHLCVSCFSLRHSSRV
ncbi:piggyBac transposable element-derived protein 4 isoform X3 [Hyalella azteca]|uniref:PiggyBac transposable element-derived protein 4 isoform X3 n=1 Tax=Hyalella azteca TaxID=294128 RepID=A0A8B7NKN4_HYAAZ|nr:piggyBac transposable element-derived protein 4 isoform X3 [Hyalella azteca]